MKFSLRCAYNTDRIYEKYPQIKENFKTEEEHTDLENFHYIYIKNIKDLLKLKEVTQQDLIICDDVFHPNMFQIIIYDDWIE